MFVVAQIIAQRELARRGHDTGAASNDMVFAAVLGTLIGAKLYYVVVLRTLNAIFEPRRLRVLGRLHRLASRCARGHAQEAASASAGSATSAASAIAAGYAVGRTGCWAVGDDYGRPWSGFLAVAFPEGAPPSTAANMAGAVRHSAAAGHAVRHGARRSIPTQLYETVIGFVMFAILWRLRDHKHAEGWLFGLYCVLAGLERFIIEFFRAKDDRLFYGLTYAQVIAIGVRRVRRDLDARVLASARGWPGIYGIAPARSAQLNRRPSR